MSENSTRSSGSKIPWLASIVLIVVTIPILMLIIYGNSQKSGVEFSPDDFSLREFNYAKIEWLNWTLRGVRHYDRNSDFSVSLVFDGWIKPVTKSEKTWHLVSDSVTSIDSADFDAKILCDYLKMPFWSEWNDDPANKAKAKAMWPAVAVLARNYVYWAIPDLMDLALNGEDLNDQEFISQAEQVTYLALMEASQAKTEEKDFELALTQISSAIELRETKKALLARAKLYDELEKTELATADRKAAQELE